jgi:hypothetical protein
LQKRDVYNAMKMRVINQAVTSCAGGGKRLLFSSLTLILNLSLASSLSSIARIGDLSSFCSL